MLIKPTQRDAAEHMQYNILVWEVLGWIYNDLLAEFFKLNFARFKYEI